MIPLQVIELSRSQKFHSSLRTKFRKWRRQKKPLLFFANWMCGRILKRLWMRCF